MYHSLENSDIGNTAERFCRLQKNKLVYEYLLLILHYLNNPAGFLIDSGMTYAKMSSRVKS
jgi:hypothetical protein